MKIGIISHLKFPICEPFAGGLEMHTHALARGLMKRGHEVKVYATADSDPALNVNDMHLNTLDYGAYRNFEPDTEYFSEQFVQEHHAYLDLMLRIDEEELDIIHNNSLNYLPISMAHTIRTPMVTSLHTPPFSWLQSAVRCEQKYGKVHYVSVSKQNAFSWYPFVRNCDIIYNGIDLKQWQFSAQAKSNEAVWFGRIVPEKGAHLAIQAASLAGMNISLAGPVCDQVYYQEEIMPLLSDKVRYYGHLTHAQLVQLIGGAGVFLCTPRWEEPYGLVIAEALACGTPVAAFRRGAIPELINDKTGRLASPDDVDALADAALSAVTLNRKDCRAYAERSCSVDHMIDSYLEFYNQIVPSRSLTWEAV